MKPRRIAACLPLLLLLPACASGRTRELASASPAVPEEAFPDPETLTLVTWNLGGGRCPTAPDEVAALADGAAGRRAADVLVLQEAPAAVGARLQAEGLGHSFWGGPSDPGLVSASRVAPVSSGPVAGANALVTEYPLANGRTLLVANVNNRAPRWPGRWQREVDLVLEALEDHPGPVVLCGDLATDDEDRRLYLADATYRALRMKHARPDGDAPGTRSSWWRGTESGIPLVHVYYRGMFLEHSEWLGGVPGADQPPLLATFRFAPLPDDAGG